MAYVAGRTYLAIPGPSVAPDRVLNAMHQAAPNIYEGDIVEMTRSIAADLKRVAMTEGYVAIYIANGHGGWEAAFSNMFSRGDRALIGATGRFGHGWADAARRMGVAVEMIDFGKSAPVDPAQIAEALKADPAHSIRAVLVTHVDTASSARSDIPAIRAAIDATGHPALLAVDAIASLAADEMRMDEWGIDVLVGASQKGLMLPPGLAFVWFSEKALEMSQTADLVTPYWDWKPRGQAVDFYQYFGGTAPTAHLFGLRESLTMILEEEGLPAVWARHETLARSVWAAFEAWGAGSNAIGLNMAEPVIRGRSVTAARIGNGGAGALRKWLETDAGVTLGIGLGMALPSEPAYQDFLRVAHMGHVNAHMTLGVLASMEAGMQALGIPHGGGAVEAAAAAFRREALRLATLPGGCYGLSALEEGPMNDFQLAACAEMLWRDKPIEWRASRLRELGFGVGLWNWPEHDLAKLEKTGAEFTIMNGYLRGRLTDDDGAAELLQTARETAQVGKRLGVARLNLHGTGLGDGGLPAQPVEVVTGAMWLKAADTLRRIADMADEEGVVFTLENLNLSVDHPGTPFGRAEDTLALVSSVDHPRLRLNLDLYHAQIGEGNLIELCRKCLPWIGEIQVADVPGRCEPGTGEVNWHGIAKALHGMGYSGPVGMEAFASGDPEAALAAFRESFTL